MKKLIGLTLGLALACTARGQSIVDYAMSMSNFAVRLDGGSGATSTAISVVQDEGSDLNTTLSKINFVGSGVACVTDLANQRATCTISSGGYTTVMDEGVGLTARSNLDFAGAGVTCADSGGTKTLCTIPGGAGFGDPGANGVMVRTALNTSVARTLTAADTSVTITNGTGVSANPTFATSVNTTDTGGAIVGQSSSPGTTQTTNPNFTISGIGRFQADAIGTTNTNRLRLDNGTAATGGATVQQSPDFRLFGAAWNSGASRSDSVSMRIAMIPVSGATTSGYFRIDGCANAAACTYTSDLFRLNFDGSFLASNGITTTAGGVTVTAGDVAVQNGDVVITGTGDDVRWVGRGVIRPLTSGSDGELAILSSGGGITGSALYANELHARSVTGAGNAMFKSTQESLTLSSGTSVNTSMSIPADSIILGISYRITTSLDTALGLTGFQVGDSVPTATRFCSTQSVLTSGTTGTCLNAMQGGISTNATGPVDQGSGSHKIRVTAIGGTGFNGGVIRLVIHYIQLIPPTS
jgi:hypothetical protein